MAQLLVLGCKGCGSAIVEAALAVGGFDYACEEVDYSPGSPTRDRLLAVNPLAQVPALVTPEGTLTETGAILHFLQDRNPGLALIPPPDHPDRARFYRWLFFINAALYPTWTYGDDPKKWVPDDSASKLLRESTDNHRKALWMQLEAECGSPWFLGDHPSALDLYVTVMTRWRPGRKWFEANTPRLVAVANLAAEIPLVAAVLERNFG
jgi:GST-like protein